MEYEGAAAVTNMVLHILSPACFAGVDLDPLRCCRYFSLSNNRLVCLICGEKLLVRPMIYRSCSNTFPFLYLRKLLPHKPTGRPAACWHCLFVLCKDNPVFTLIRYDCVWLHDAGGIKTLRGRHTVELWRPVFWVKVHCLLLFCLLSELFPSFLSLHSILIYTCRAGLLLHVSSSGLGDCRLRRLFQPPPQSSSSVGIPGPPESRWDIESLQQRSNPSLTCPEDLRKEAPLRSQSFSQHPNHKTTVRLETSSFLKRPLMLHHCMNEPQHLVEGFGKSSLAPASPPLRCIILKNALCNKDKSCFYGGGNTQFVAFWSLFTVYLDEEHWHL